ncbi:MAG: 4-hydroxyphenylacetate decarboxylase activase [Hyphomicrobiales bacterium]
MSIVGNIFDVQSFSVHDGPGTRTTIFLKGCPLKCEWCCNPESWSKHMEVLYRSFKCKGCGKCVSLCNKHAISIDDNKGLRFDKSLCNDCTSFECVDACCNEAIELIGKEYSVDDVINLLLRHQNSWGDDGGVTFSGGESLYQREFLLEVLKKCQQHYIHTAIETTAFCKTEAFLEVMKYVDFSFIDIKHMDSDQHKKKTGVSNELILHNIIKLIESDWDGHLIIRVPLIEGFNDNEENINRVVEFMNNVGLKEVNLLPFHRMGESKWTGIGKEYSYAENQPTPESIMNEFQTIFESKGISCYLGGDLPI